MRIIKLSLLLILGLLLIIIFIPFGYFVLGKPKQLNIPQESNPHGIAAYFINMERSKERLAYILPNVEKLHLPFERIEAVDGAKLTQEDFAQAIDIEAYNKFLGYVLNPGVVGCALSHIKAWETFLASPYEYAIIFEDDVSFNPAEVLAAIQHLQKNTQYWDIANLDTDLRGFPLTIKSFGDMRMVAYLTRIHHTGAYIINRHAAKQLLAKALPIILPVDLYFNRGWELDLKFVGIEPRIVKQTFGDSTIEITKGNNYYSDLKYNISRRLFIFQTNLIRFVYNLWNVISDWFV
jgi:glycosyl transferase family 25